MKNTLNKIEGNYMDVVVKMKSPLKGEVYVSEIEGKKFVFQLIDVKNLNQEKEYPHAPKRKQGEYPGFGFASKKVRISEKDITEAKKSLFRDINV